MSAWLASACGDVERERRELAALVAADPEDFAALERLAKLAPPESAEPGRRRPAAGEGGDRTRPGAVSRALSSESAGARRRGDGPPGGTAGPSLRGDRLPDRRDRRGAGPRRPPEALRRLEESSGGWMKPAEASSTGSRPIAARRRGPNRPLRGVKESIPDNVFRIPNGYKDFHIKPLEFRNSQFGISRSIPSQALSRPWASPVVLGAVGIDWPGDPLRGATGVLGRITGGR